ncbi:hypothetical protein QYE76_060602 [Lolium multiflorum]|uniref:Aminotransferase-like plant mobile domain-containing protein n=1 Tax=Lolium multiflorum TaxID=4521 RepID=A0AAD8W6Q3_LOLMU|nr:hypothetical protein QYE76_060602 [Lolium multiflorum]
MPRNANNIDRIIDNRNAQGPSRVISKRATILDEDWDINNSSDSDFVLQIIDSDNDIEDGDDALYQEYADQVPKVDKKGAAEDELSEDEFLEAPDSDEETERYNFKAFTEEDMHDPKFHVGPIFQSIEMLRKAIREYNCKHRRNITLPKNDKARLSLHTTHGNRHHMPADERVDEVGHAGPAGAHDRKQFVLAGLPGDAIMDAIMLDGSVPEEARQLLVRDGKQHLRPMVWLLDEEYDRVHRAVHMTERNGSSPFEDSLPWHSGYTLDEACRRSGSGGIGGCMLLLSVWSWDRLSVGRPRTLTRGHGLITLFPDREPTWAYLWDNVSEMTSDPMVMYRQYTAELDTLTAEQVEWEPYGTYYRIGAGMPDLNHKCTEEARFCECPVWQDTDKALHRLDRQRQRKITNWPVHHSGHVAAFQHCLEVARNAGPEQIVPHDFAAFNNYLEWFHENTRIELVKHAYPEEILDDPIQFDEVGQSQHDTFARRGRSTSIASELNFVREEIQKTVEECEVMWEQSGRDDKPVGPLRYFIKVVTEEDDRPPRRSALSRMRNDEPFSSDEEEEEEEEEQEQQEQQQQQPRQRTKRMAVRKQPARTARRGRY